MFFFIMQKLLDLGHMTIKEILVIVEEYIYIFAVQVCHRSATYLRIISSLSI